MSRSLRAIDSHPRAERAGKTALLKAIDLLLGSAWPSLRSFASPRLHPLRHQLVVDDHGELYAKFHAVGSPGYSLTSS
jgi:hypothetical protein